MASAAARASGRGLAQLCQPLGLPAVGMIGLAFTHGYRRVVRIGIAVGLAELAFIPAMLLAHPKISAIAGQLGSQPLGQSSNLTLLAATSRGHWLPEQTTYSHTH